MNPRARTPHAVELQSNCDTSVLWYSFRDCQFEDWPSSWTER